MAITEEEIKKIVSQVLSSILTNSRSIDQLSPVASVNEDDWLELNGGRRVSFIELRDAIRVVTPEMMKHIESELKRIDTVKDMVTGGQTVDIQDVDTMHTDGSASSLRELTAIGNSRWTLMINGYVAGVLDLISDSTQCELTQILTTHCTLSNGQLTMSHTDGVLHTYHRSTPLSSVGAENLGVERGSWTDWQELGASVGELALMQSEIAEMKRELTEIRSLLANADANYAVLSVEWLEDEQAGVWSSVLPSRIDRQIKLRIGVDVNAEHQREGVSDWSVRRHSSDVDADLWWDARHPLETNEDGYTTIVVGPEDILDSAGTLFDFSANYTRIRNGVSYSQAVSRRVCLEMGGIAFIVDHGPWAVGERYLNMQINPEGRLETSDAWRYGNKWRCQATHTATEDNGPGFGNPLWTFIEGDDQFHVSFASSQEVVDPTNIYLPLAIQALYHGEDVLRFISDEDVVWSRYSEDNSGEPRVELDAQWNAANAGRGKNPVFTEADFQTQFSGYAAGVSRVTFTAVVTLRDPLTSARIKAYKAYTV